MATIKQMQEIERKCGSVQMRMAVHQLFSVGYDAYRKVDDGQVESVSINGDDDFDEGDIFQKEASVVITYHSTR